MAMAVSDAIQLVTVSVSKDRYGVDQETETTRQVYCKARNSQG